MTLLVFGTSVRTTGGRLAPGSAVAVRLAVMGADAATGNYVPLYALDYRRLADWSGDRGRLQQFNQANRSAATAFAVTVSAGLTLTRTIHVIATTRRRDQRAVSQQRHNQFPAGQGLSGSINGANPARAVGGFNFGLGDYVVECGLVHIVTSCYQTDKCYCRQLSNIVKRYF